MPAQLLYFADPMCSWCWGFEPVLRAVHSEFADRLKPVLILGGLRPYTETPMTEADKAEVREHWTHVAEASGQPFDYSFFERPRFVYDTEPASRAVVTMGALLGSPAFSYFAAVQRAFYAHNRDVTDAEVLLELAVANGADAGEFSSVFASAEAQRETFAHFQTAQRLGVTGFPTLAAANALGEGEAVAAGYAPYPAVRERIETFLAQA
jgi:putative protein-disulfide isomerase